MAYGQKYSVTFATRADKNVVLKIWQDSYTGAIINLQGTGVNLEYIPNSDDPYEPIFASQLGISIDFTDNLSDIINFTNIDDRYNYVEMFVNGVIQWVGFIINDNVQVSYSTGRKIATFNATDGLGMLKDIPFVPPVGNLGVNDSNDLVSILRICFNSIDFKDDRNTVTMCSYFANGMSNRAVDAWRDPFKQTYMCYRNFLKDEYTYTNCLDIISNIAKSFGCRVFQANGKWWIVAINEFAEINAYYTEYNNTNGLKVNNGDGYIINTSSTIQPYLTNTSGLYFIDNSQLKILKKGFYKIIAEGTVDMADNYFPNGNLADNNSTDATFWTRTPTGDATVTLAQNTILDYYYFELVTVPGGPVGTASISLQTASQPKVSEGDSINLNITIGCSTTASSIGFIELTITDGTTTYYLNNNKEWQTGVTLYSVYNPKTSGVSEEFVLNLETAPVPATMNGTLSFKYTLGEGAINFTALYNFILKIKSDIGAYNLTGTISENNQYTKTVSFPYGSNGSDSYYPSAKGSLLLSNGSIAIGWYRYGDYTAVVFLNPAELLIQQYINTYGQNIINLDASVSSFYTANTTYRILNAAKLIFATDTDPASINVSGKSYMLGNATIDFPNDQTNLTLLQISNTEIVCTRVNEYSPQTSTF